MYAKAYFSPFLPARTQNICEIALTNWIDFT